MENNAVNIPELKWQYIAFEQNYVISYPATRINWPNYNPRLRYIENEFLLGTSYTPCIARNNMSRSIWKKNYLLFPKFMFFLLFVKNKIEVSNIHAHTHKHTHTYIHTHANLLTFKELHYK